MKRAVLSLLLAVTPFPEVVQTPAEQAAAVWEKALLAKGGKERLRGIDNVLRSSRIPSRFIDRSWNRQVEELFVLPNKFWRYEDPTVGERSASTLDLESRIKYFIWDTNRSPRKSVADPKEEGWRFELLQAVELLETRWMHLDPIRTWSETEGSRLSVVVEGKFQMSAGWASATFSLDSETYLPHRVVVREPIANDFVLRLVFDFLEYTDVNGIKMPQLMRRSGDELHFDEKLTYRFNVDYDAELFRTGPTIQHGPEDWKRRSK